MNRKITKLFLVLSVVMGLLLVAGCGEISTSALKNNTGAAVSSMADPGGSSFTLMVYMCGSNLESYDGSATEDMMEMIDSGVGENVKVVVEAGGANTWQNDIIPDGSVGRYLLNKDGLAFLQDRTGKHMMTSAEVTDFIKFAKEEYPADRYGFIFWNHGGGTMAGYGEDEIYPGEDLSIQQIAQAFAGANTHFAFIGFDACLMSTLEIAYSLSPYADYMIASEETEPGTGWYHTNYLAMLEENPGIAIPKVGKQVVDDYMNPEYTDTSDGLTMACIDLKEAKDIVNDLYTCTGEMDQTLLNGGYTELSTARSDTRSYGDDGYDQIDIKDFMNHVKLTNAAKLIKDIDEAVVANGTNLPGSNGLAMYYPYSCMDGFEDTWAMLSNMGMTDTNYQTFFADFASIMYGGQMNGGGTENPYGTEEATDYTDITSSDWYNSETVSQYTSLFDYINADYLTITEKNGGYVLHLSDDDWDLVTDIEQQIYIDDGEGYLALGSDDYFEYDADGDLKVDFDNKWINLNDSLVAYYHANSGTLSDGTTFSEGYVPAVLNDSDDIKIWLRWDTKHTDPYVLGYTFDNDNSAMDDKGYFDFKAGDKINPTFKYYDYDDNFVDNYNLTNNALTYSSNGIKVHYGDIGKKNVEVYYYMKDIYQNEYWTQPLLINAK